MLGAYDLVCIFTMVDLRTSVLGRSGIFVSSVVFDGWNVTEIIYSGGSSGACTYYVGVLWFILKSMLVSSMDGSSSASSVV